MKNLLALSAIGTLCAQMNAAPPAMQLSATWTTVDCNGAIFIDLTVTGGVGPNFNYYWSSPLGSYTSYQNDEDITVYSGGTYSVVVFDPGDVQPDGSNASVVETFTIGMTGVVVDDDCDGTPSGAVDLMPPGDLVPPLSYGWSGPDGFYATTEDISNIVSDRYYVVVTDANGCFHVSIFNVQSTALQLNYTITPNGNGCSPPAGSIDLDVNGGTPPYTYEWTFGQISEDIDELIAAWYWVKVTDANGCYSISDWILVPPGENIIVSGQVDPTCYFGELGAIDVSVSGGTAPYSYSWWEVGGFSSTGKIFQALAMGTTI